MIPAKPGTPRDSGSIPSPADTQCDSGKNSEGFSEVCSYYQIIGGRKPSAFWTQEETFRFNQKD